MDASGRRDAVQQATAPQRPRAHRPAAISALAVSDWSHLFGLPSPLFSRRVTVPPPAAVRPSVRRPLFARRAASACVCSVPRMCHRLPGIQSVMSAAASYPRSRRRVAAAAAAAGPVLRLRARSHLADHAAPRTKTGPRKKAHARKGNGYTTQTTAQSTPRRNGRRRSESQRRCRCDQSQQQQQRSAADDPTQPASHAA